MIRFSVCKGIHNFAILGKQILPSDAYIFVEISLVSQNWNRKFKNSRYNYFMFHFYLPLDKYMSSIWIIGFLQILYFKSKIRDVIS